MSFEVHISSREMDSLLFDLRGIPGQAEDEVHALIREYTRKIHRTLKELLSQPGSGRLYPSRTGSGMHRASAPGEPPAPDTGEYRASIRREVKRLAGEVFTNEERATALEFGNRKGTLAARPHFRPAFEAHREDLIRDLRAIKLKWGR